MIAGSPTGGFNGYDYADAARKRRSHVAPDGFGVTATPSTADTTGRYTYGINADQIVRYMDRRHCRRSEVRRWCIALRTIQSARPAAVPSLQSSSMQKRRLPWGAAFFICPAVLNPQRSAVCLPLPDIGSFGFNGSDIAGSRQEIRFQIRLSSRPRELPSAPSVP